MATMNKSISIFFYEIIERIVRFDVHLEEIKEQFYHDNENKKSLINDFKTQLSRLFFWIFSNKDETGSLLENLETAQEIINELHTKYLSILPRPHEPIELIRFERVIKKQIIKLKSEKDLDLDISIAINEAIGESTENDYLSEFKDYFGRKLNLACENLEKQQNSNKTPIPITIPRIDASNTFRWPSLIHEMCHHLLAKNIKFTTENIETDFLSFVGRNINKKDIFESFFAKNIDNTNNVVPDLLKWLTECFCDLFACILIGPSFYFSQFIVFLNNCKNTNIESHPPHQLRLVLIESIIRRRFPKLYNDILSNHINKCNELMELVQKDYQFNFEKLSVLNDIYNSFDEFFRNVFFKSEGGIAQVKGNEEISDNLTEIITKYVTIQSDVITSLTDRLKQGLPIPGIRTGNSKETYEEIPTYVQEIFLASWLAKLSFDSQKEPFIPKGLIASSFDKMNEFDETCETNDILTLYDELKKKIIRHDQAVLKSIQVSEWFDILTGEKTRIGEIKLFTLNDKDFDISETENILVDKEIKSLIFQDELKIIPLMYTGQNIQDKERKQIGTTSVDIRLGTSFQVFYPDQYGIIDFADSENTYSFRESSKRIDLDFLGNITIAPGQFLLGHSMEYIQLPDTICGNLEGRSSFARLGIEIHMTAGFIDPGFEGVITFEIYNAGPTTVRLYPGMRIGQIRFEKNSEPQNPYNKQNVKYKGLLEHNVSLQSKDIEVELIKKYLNKNK